MKALIFAAGLGTRLKPLTNDRPKALVTVNGVTLLEHVIRRLSAQGFDEIVINVHHFADLIIDFLRQKHNFGLTIHVSDERDRLLETGGGIKKALPLLTQTSEQPFLIHNVDILSNADLRTLFEEHRASGADATLLVSQRKSSRNLLFDNDKRLRGWMNLDTRQTKPRDFDDTELRDLDGRAFSGIHIISPTLFRDFDAWQGKFSVIDFYLSLVESRMIKASEQEGLHLIDVGKLENLEQAARFLA